MPEQSREADEILSGPDSEALRAITSGEIDVQVATAKKYQRNITDFLKKAEGLATLTQETAEACMYAVPRDGKVIEGPSARFAEIVSYCFSNMRIGSTPLMIDDEHVTVRGAAWDIENNVLRFSDVKRRITMKTGRRYNADMISVTTNAANSIAARNAVLQTIPAALWRPIWLKAKKVAVGDANTLAARRKSAIDYFTKLGAPPEKVYELLEVKGLEDITLEHIGVLLGLVNSIKEGERTVEDIFALVKDAGPKEPTRVKPEKAAEPGVEAEPVLPPTSAWKQAPPPPLAEPPPVPPAEPVPPPTPPPPPVAARPVVSPVPASPTRVPAKPTAADAPPPVSPPVVPPPSVPTPEGERYTLTGLLVKSSQYVTSKPKAKGDKAPVQSYYEIVTADHKGREITFVTKDGAIGKDAATFEDTDHKVKITYVDRRQPNGSTLHVATKLELDEAEPVPPVVEEPPVGDFNWGD